MIEIKAPQAVPLSAPFSDKEKVKALGARWNGGNRSWEIPKGKDMVPFMEWMTEPMLGLVRKTLAENGIEEKPEEEAISLFQLLNSVKGVINSGLPDAYWVKAEILHYQHNNHVYLELSDYGLDKSNSAKARAMVWSSSLNIISNFEKETGMKLQQGLKVLVQVSVDFHPQFGLSLVVKSIDSSFTLGDMESKLREIRDKLIADGIYDLNRSMDLPVDFTRIAVIAPANAAGLGDFKTQSDVLHRRGLCHFDYYSASFQGAKVEESIYSAFTNIEGKIDDYDAIIMIRGGGDKAGLYELNTEFLAALVCKSKIPVIVGIGHERDNTILDEVCCLRCPTPSMVIGHVVGTIVGNARDAISSMKTLRQNMSQAIYRSRNECNDTMNFIKDICREVVYTASRRNENLMTTIKRHQSNTIIEAKSNIKLMMKDILLQNPKNVLEHGYAIVRNGKTVITSAKEAQKHENLTIQFKDGKLN